MNRVIQRCKINKNKERKEDEEEEEEKEEEIEDDSIRFISPSTKKNILLKYVNKVRMTL